MSHSKLHQIMRLREMLKKWRRKALKKAHSFSETGGRTLEGSSSAHPRRSISMPIGGAAAAGAAEGRVPAGHLAVYVGEERRRFVIKMWYLSHPLFRALLKKTEEEIGFKQEGALALPCEVPVFENLLRIIQSGKSHHHNIITCSAPPHHHHHRQLAHYPLNADDRYQELLLQLLQSSDLPPSTLSPRSTLHDPLCHPSLSRSLYCEAALVA